MINQYSNIYTKEEISECVSTLKKVVKMYFKDDKIYSNTLFKNSFDKMIDELRRLQVFLKIMEDNNFELMVSNGNGYERAFYTKEEVENIEYSSMLRIRRR